MGSPLERTVRARRVAGVAGDLGDQGFADKQTFFNDSPRAAQVDTVTVAVSTDTEDYSVEIDGIEVLVTAASATAADVAKLFVDAINAEQQINGTVIATQSTADVVITARVAGEGFVTALGDNAAKMTLANTLANDEANPLGFGLAVQLDGFGSEAGDSATAKLIDDNDVTDTATADELLVGVTLRDKSQELDLDSDEAQYAPNEPMSILRGGRVYVAIEAALVASSRDVYVRTTADGDLDVIGGFAPASGAGLVRWSNAKFVRQVGSGLAVIDVRV